MQYYIPQWREIKKVMFLPAKKPIDERWEVVLTGWSEHSLNISHTTLLSSDCLFYCSFG
jgi:hypothetical protein